MIRQLGRVLLAMAALMLLFFIIFYGTLAYQGLRDPVVTVDDEDVTYVINWLDKRGEPVEILNSYDPPANWSGDFEKEFSLKIDADAVARFVSRSDTVRGDRIAGDLLMDVDFALVFAEKLAWFPDREMILSDKFYVAPVRTELPGSSTVYLVLVAPEQSILYYVEANM